MASRVSSEFQRFLQERKLVRSRISPKMIFNEIEAAKKDLEDAKDSFERRKFKWSIIQAYYSMFHSARALLYHRGFREKGHYALLVAIRELFQNELDDDIISSFEEGMELRQEADYGLTFSEEGASETIGGAASFLQRARELLKMK